MTVESWKFVPGYGTEYEVSSLGSVRNARTGKQIKPFRQTNKKYLRVNLYNEARVLRQWGVHQLVAMAFIGPRTGNLCVNHIDCDPTNNRIENLEYCTPKENSTHASVNGLLPSVKGELNGASKLREDEVMDIKYLSDSGFTDKQISEMFCVSQACISAIRRGKNWADVPVGPWQKPTTYKLFGRTI